MVTRVIVLLSFAGAVALGAFAAGGEAAAQTRRQPYDVPNLVPRYAPNTMRKDEPWRFREENPYALKDEEPYPYTTPQSRARVEKSVREYNATHGVDVGDPTDYLPPKPRASGSSRPLGGSGPCTPLFETCR